ncbi:AMP-binding protein [Halopseudomonas salegens]|uniref:Fatty-acyl-CoA synthase n=1 Tax=Halopseudomonas salegens TaxID=1434072 RepID=A0A1H2FIU9_9GAMM|nr:AMP-binding protein [Halopseudomonas salegens]SDU07232.1 fatty-acyl-CoA synthase [Halopseudomonas salegens]
MAAPEQSRWLTVTRQMVNQHALTTGDGFAEWVHCDDDRAAREMPYGGAIVQGFLQVALLIQLCQDIGDDDHYDINHSLNYGFDRLRFLHPLVVGRAVRARVNSREKTPHPRGGIRLKLAVELEDDQGNVVLAADWLFYRQPIPAPINSNLTTAGVSRWTEVLQQLAASRPDKPAWTLAEQTFTHNQVWREVQQLASALRQAGIRPGDRVAVLASPRPEPWALFLACCACDAIYVALDPAGRDTTLTTQIAQADPALIMDLLAEPRLTEQPGLLQWSTVEVALPQLAAAIAAVQCRAAQTPHPENALLDTRDARLLVFTPGSSGEPKGVLHSEATLLRMAAEISRGLDLTARSRMLCHLPMGHLSGLLDTCAAAQWVGAKLVFQPVNKPAKVLATISGEAISVLIGVPAWCVRLLADKRWAHSDFSALQRIVLIAERPGTELCRRLLKTGAIVQRGYGLSEGVSLCSLSPPGLAAPELSESVGRILPGIRARLVDELGLDVPEGAAGEIQLPRDWRMLAYWRDPQSTQAVLTPDGWLHSGDLAVADAAGTLRLQGRLAGRFLSVGQEVVPEVIEEALESLDQVVQAVVVSVSDAVRGAVGVAFVVPVNFQVDAAELEAALSELLPVEQLPRHWVLSADLPLLSIGKPDRALLSLDAEHVFAGSKQS